MTCRPWLESGEKDKRERFTFIGPTNFPFRISKFLKSVTTVLKLFRLLTTGTIEEKIFQRQILKQGLSGAIVDSRDSKQGHFTREELKVCVFEIIDNFFSN